MSFDEPSLDRLILDTVASLVIVTDHEGRIVRFNRACEKTLGYARGEVMGKFIWDMFPLPENRAATKQRFEQLMAGVLIERESIWLTKSGERRHIALSVRGGPEGGPIRYTIGTGDDITHRVQAEAAWRESEERFRASFANSAVGMAITGLDGRFVKVNRAYSEITGLTEEELRGTDFLAVTDPADRERNGQMVRALIEGRIPSGVIEKRYVRRAGQPPIWAQVSLSLAHDSLGRPLNVIALVENITERRQAEADLRESEERFRLVVQNSPDMMYYADTEHRVTWVSKTLSPAQPQDVIGRVGADFVGPAEARRITEIAERVVKTGIGERLDTVADAGGRQVHIEIALERRTDPDGRVLGVAGYVHDVGERIRTEQELRAFNERLKDLNQTLELRVAERTAAAEERARALALSEAALREREAHYRVLAESNQRLVRELEHRVRNNLTALLGLVRVMRDRALDVQAYADAIEGRLVAMTHVHHLLAAEGWVPVSLRTLVESTLAAMRYTAPHHIATTVEGPEVFVGPAQVLPLTLVLVEWFTNSCKYGAHTTPAGRLTIRWNLAPDASPGTLRLTWTEEGGPPITVRPRPSLGTQLVEGFVGRELAGRCELRYPPEGADHLIEFRAEGGVHEDGRALVVMQGATWDAPREIPRVGDHEYGAERVNEY
ncbi:MAG TPA: PAS domain S-box protein [Tepidisphaeraceae bacterium]|jgi:PAS domain S-box-containing protein|nr:PAS domain S-box protein [Tepidisphaeraceae bacterium]